VSIRKRGERSYQVRVEPFPAKTFPTRAGAKAYELELLTRRAQGDRYSDETRTLGAEIDAWLDRHQAMSDAVERTTEFYERSAKIWEPFRGVKVSALRRAAAEDFIGRRASEHRRSAQNELAFLKRVLRDARGRGQRVDEAVLSIPPIKARPRTGWALSVEQLYEFASWFPEHSTRLVLLAGMIGARQRVWFEMTDELLDLQNGALNIPATIAKNRRAHRVYLTNLEVGLFREQLMARAPGVRLVFPTPPGKHGRAAGSASESGLRRSRRRSRTTGPAVRRCSTASPSISSDIQLVRSWRSQVWIQPSPRSGPATRTEARSFSVSTGTCTRPRNGPRPFDWRRL